MNFQDIVIILIEPFYIHDALKACLLVTY